MNRGLVIFDMDGTVLDHNSWRLLHHAFGLSDAEDDTMLRWYSEGILNYAEWTNLITKIYLARGFATKLLALEVFGRCAPSPVAFEVVAEIKSRGFEVALASAGIDILVESTAKRLEISRYRANHHMVFDDEGHLTNIEILDNESSFKVTTLKAFCADIGIPVNACFCVGDGLNDRDIFSLTGQGVLICPPETLPPFENYWRRVSNLSLVPDAIPSRPGGRL
ncbi:MAG: HAD-IB family phosphatase [Planctomycetota bacterium]|nr:HAD-IB family phosphatase [Planctomycetota bacterium]